MENRVGRNISQEEAKKDKTKLKLALDSNIFRNYDFINYLTLNKFKFQVFMPTIVQLEVGYYYIIRGISWEEFVEDIKKFDGIFLHWDNSLILKVIQNAFTNQNQLPFKKHFRDFLIGTECEKIQAPIITYNFMWLNKIKIFTPEEYLLEL
ncbi:MAG: hypothetical protein ACTSP9_06035 [Promethearchaeota archaeon]